MMHATRIRYRPNVHGKDKVPVLSPSDQEKHLPQPPLEVPPDPKKPIIPLPKPETIIVPPRDLRTAIEERHSVRAYAREPLTLEELAFLLWCTQGVKKVTGTYATFRNVPSAGARHALETYLLINDVEGLKPGLYRYLALTHRLQQLDMDPTLYIRIAQACLDQQFIMRCGVVFLWVAVPYRMTWRYSERGYRSCIRMQGMSARTSTLQHRQSAAGSVPLPCTMMMSCTIFWESMARTSS